MPSLSACWRSAPAVRFIILEIRATGVFDLECLRSSACCAFDQATRFDFLVFFTFFAMQFSCCAGLLTRKKHNGYAPAAGNQAVNTSTEPGGRKEQGPWIISMDLAPETIRPRFGRGRFN